MSLLSGCTSGGCGAKLGPGELSDILRTLPRFDDPRLLVGFDGSDDACVYQLDAHRSLVCTVDFFPPMVDDPFAFGCIAAANALSDAYAMGADPLVALNLACFPQSMDRGVLAQILQGGAQKVLEAGAVIAGGHTIYDHEPKYGLSVTGVAETARILRNDTPRAGDRLILTKPLGTGIVLAAHRVDMADAEALEAALCTMQRLNRDASRAMRRFDVSACTDVTGFGLLAHAREMAGQHATLCIDPAALPLIPRALDYAQAYMTTAAGQRNRNHLAGACDLSGISPALAELMFDPQTSGGLLIAVNAADSDALLAEIRRTDRHAALIGRVQARGPMPIILERID